MSGPGCLHCHDALSQIHKTENSVVHIPKNKNKCVFFYITTNLTPLITPYVMYIVCIVLFIRKAGNTASKVGQIKHSDKYSTPCMISASETLAVLKREIRKTVKTCVDNAVHTVMNQVLDRFERRIQILLAGKFWLTKQTVLFYLFVCLFCTTNGQR